MIRNRNSTYNPHRSHVVFPCRLTWRLSMNWQLNYPIWCFQLVNEDTSRPIALLVFVVLSLIGWARTHTANHTSATGFAIGDIFASPFAPDVWQQPSAHAPFRPIVDSTNEVYFLGGWNLPIPPLWVMAKRSNRSLLSMRLCIIDSKWTNEKS